MKFIDPIPIVLFLFLSCSKPATDGPWIGPFVKVDSVNPILTPGTGKFFCPVRKQLLDWENKDVFNPAAVIRDGHIYLIYRAEDTIGIHKGTSRLGLAISSDGLHFKREPEPVFYPANDSMNRYEWEGGVEDPRIVLAPDGRYIMTYTAYDGKVARLCLAISTDLMSWQKAGPVLRGKYRDWWSKSGAIVAAHDGQNLIAKSIPAADGSNRYHMYFGDTDLFMATSTDLLNWSIVEKNGEPLSVLKPRPGKFDSRLVEPGPCAMWREDGIVLLYNGMNLDHGGDPELPAGAYSSGQALFNPGDPTELISRTDNWFLRPDKPYEIEGQINQVCFIEGLVRHNNRWLLYYGTADSRIAVAVTQQ
ncbi:MAG: glycoside hydrolase family 130 protein [Bacteroidota bacterium]